MNFIKLGLFAFLAQTALAGTSIDFGELSVDDSFTITAKNLYKGNLTQNALLYSYFGIYGISEEPPLIPMTKLGSMSKIYDQNSLKHSSERNMYAINCTRLLTSNENLLVVGCFNKIPPDSNDYNYQYVGIIDTAGDQLYSVIENKECIFYFKAWGKDILICKTYVFGDRVEIEISLIEIDFDKRLLTPHIISPLFKKKIYSGDSFRCVLEDKKKNCSFISLKFSELSQKTVVLQSIFQVSNIPFELIETGIIEQAKTVLSNIDEFSFTSIYPTAKNSKRIIFAGWSRNNGLISTELRDCAFGNELAISDCQTVDLSPDKTNMKLVILIDMFLSRGRELNKNELYLVVMNDSGKQFNMVVKLVQSEGIKWIYKYTSIISILRMNGGPATGIYYEPSNIRMLSPLQFAMSWKCSSVPNILVSFDSYILDRIETAYYFRGEFSIQHKNNRVWTIYENRFFEFSTNQADSNLDFFMFEPQLLGMPYSTFIFHTKLGVVSQSGDDLEHQGTIRISQDPTLMRSEQSGVFTRIVSTIYPNRLRISNFAVSGERENEIVGLPKPIYSSADKNTYLFFSYKTGEPLDLKSPIVFGDYLLSGDEIRRCKKQILRRIELFCHEGVKIDLPLTIPPRLKWLRDYAVFDSKSSSKTERELLFLHLESRDISRISILEFKNSMIKIISPETGYFLIAGIIDGPEKMIKIISYDIKKMTSKVYMITRADHESVLCALSIDIQFEDSIKVYYSSYCQENQESRRITAEVTINESGKRIKIQEDHSPIKSLYLEYGICGFNSTLLQPTNKGFQLTSFSDKMPVQYQISLKALHSEHKEITLFKCLEDGRVAVIWDNAHLLILDLDTIIFHRFYPYRSVTLSNIVVEILSSNDEVVYVVQAEDGTFNSHVYPINLLDSSFNGELLADNTTLEISQKIKNEEIRTSKLLFNIKKISTVSTSMKTKCIVENCIDISGYADDQGRVYLNKIFEFQGPKGDFRIEDDDGNEINEVEFRGFYETHEKTLPNKAVPLWISPSLNNEFRLLASEDSLDSLHTNIFKIDESGEKVSLVTTFKHSCRVWGSRVFSDGISIVCKGVYKTDSFISIAGVHSSGELQFNHKIHTRDLGVFHFDKVLLERCGALENCLILVLEYSKRETIYLKEIRRLDTDTPNVSYTDKKLRASKASFIKIKESRINEQDVYLVYFDESREKVVVQRLKGYYYEFSRFNLQDIGLPTNAVCYSCRDDTCVCGANGLFISLLKIQVDNKKISLKETHRFAVYKNLEISDIEFSNEKVVVTGTRIKEFTFENRLAEIDTSGVFVYDISETASTNTPIEISYFVSCTRLNCLSNTLQYSALPSDSGLLLITETKRLIHIEQTEPYIRLTGEGRLDMINLRYEPGNRVLQFNLSFKEETASGADSKLEARDDIVTDVIHEIHSSNQKAKENYPRIINWKKLLLQALTSIFILSIGIVVFFVKRRVDAISVSDSKHSESTNYTEKVQSSVVDHMQKRKQH